jgi:UDP-galactopyranose mutase
MSVDFLIVGAGFAGSVCAERLAASGYKCFIIDCRDHIGGNAFDESDAYGVIVHRYGPHIFHTNSARIFQYLSRFTEWRPYEHRSLSFVGQNLYPFPVNLNTINRFYGLKLGEKEAAAYLGRIRETRAALRTSEDIVLSSAGRDLYEKFFANYIRKQWGLNASELKASVTARVLIRTNVSVQRSHLD